MAVVQLTRGPISYEDSGGDRPGIVVLHGVLMDGSEWTPVVERLQDTHRCVVPIIR